MWNPHIDLELDGSDGDIAEIKQNRIVEYSNIA